MLQHMNAAFDRLKNLRLYTETYGCTYNHGDTEKITGIAKSRGCTIVQRPEDADAVLINTCIVVEKTEQHMYERLNRYPDKILFVTGCLPGLSAERVLASRPDACVISPDLIHARYQETGSAGSGTHAVLQIARGCNGHCTYCITRLARGKLVSYPSGDIVSRAKEMAAGGAAEIQLTAQDVSSWGTDRGTERLPDLLQELCSIPGDFRIRVGMANPDTLLPILDDTLAAFADPKIFLFLHVPAQSGSDHVLRLMGRRYAAADFAYICETAREKFPDIRISTDYIAGFPGETEEDAEASVSQIQRVKPGKINITRFSVRPGTPAAKMRQLPEPVKKERSRALTNAANAVYDENNEHWIGKCVDAMVTGIGKEGSVTARDRTYQNIVVMRDLAPGSEIRVRITGHRRHYLLGETV
jgi:MiaB-like tRNA modifying enzyme